MKQWEYYSEKKVYVLLEEHMPVSHKYGGQNGNGNCFLILLEATLMEKMKKSFE